jgi:hypothetical protein
VLNRASGRLRIFRKEDDFLAFEKILADAVSPAETNGIGNSLRRGAPLGEGGWVAAAAANLRLLSTLRPRGRPRKST